MPSVSGRLLGYTWYLVVAVLRDSSLWLSVVYGLRLSDLNKETTLLLLFTSECAETNWRPGSSLPQNPSKGCPGEWERRKVTEREGGREDGQSQIFRHGCASGGDCTVCTSLTSAVIKLF